MHHSIRSAPAGLVAGLVVVLVLGGCGEGAGREAAVEPIVRDSAGITIVENTAPLWRDGQAWRVPAAPVLEIGMLDGPEPYQLDGVRNAVRLSDGAVAVADGGSQRVRIYDGGGRHVRDLGGRGGGPGEFETLSLVRPFRGDSIAAWDSRQKRLTVFDAAGAVGRVWTVDGVEGWLVPALGWFADGSIAVTPGMDPMAMMEAEPGQRREYRRYLRVQPDGGIDTLAAIPGRDEVVYHGAGSFGTHSVLFGRDAHAAIRDEVLVVGESGHFQLLIHGDDGAVGAIVRVATEPRPVTAAERAAAAERLLESRRESSRQLSRQIGRAVEEDRSETPSRETHPFFDRLELDDSGHIWVRQPPDDPDGPGRWQVFDPHGRWLGPVETPAGLRVTDIGHDYVVGVSRDEYDVEYVRVHRLIRTEARNQHGS